MVYESDFYSTRRPYSRPSVPITSYSVTTPRYYSSDPPRRSEQQYSYTYNSTSESTKRTPGTSSVPTRSYSSSSERVSKSAGSGPGSYNYTSERSSRSSGDGPGAYSYSSVSTGVLPHGTKFRHYAYRI